MSEDSSDPILERERVIEAALRGDVSGVAAEEAEHGLTQAGEYGMQPHVRLVPRTPAYACA